MKTQLKEHIQTVTTDIQALLPAYRLRADTQMVDFIEHYLNSLAFDAYQAAVVADESKLILIYEEVNELLRDIRASLNENRARRSR
jgi:hypothetical protein